MEMVEAKMRYVIRNIRLRPGTAIKTNLNSKLPDNEVKWKSFFFFLMRSSLLTDTSSQSTLKILFEHIFCEPAPCIFCGTTEIKIVRPSSLL